jgi:hypothetical protein
MALLAGTLLLSVTPAQADDTLISFIGVSGGTISYAGGTAPLVGTGIPVSSVFSTNTPSNDGSLLPVVNGFLSFTTGAASNTGGHNWSGTTGNFFVITGDMPDLGLTNATLLSGTFGTASIAGTNTIVITLGPDTKNAALLAYYGLDPSTVFQFEGSIALNPPAPATGAFSSHAFSIDIVNRVTSCTGAIGDFVWNDLNHDGIQDSGEPGIPNIPSSCGMPAIPR